MAKFTKEPEDIYTPDRLQVLLYRQTFCINKYPQNIKFMGES